MVDYSRYQFIKVEKKDKVATITLNQPDKLNAISKDMHYELEDIFVDVDRDDEINAVIITGAGRAFSAGGDIKNMINAFEDSSLRTPMSRVKQLLLNLLAVRKPIVAAVNGHAIGVGATIALHLSLIHI